MSAEAKAPKYPILDDIEVPAQVIENWQTTADLLAEIAGTPAALIMRVHAQEIEVFVTSHSPGNVYPPGETAPLNTGLYCETVMSTQHKLVVPNALKDPDWDHNPDIKLGMVSYCGLPLTWPNGGVFGTLCILDRQENAYTQQTHQLIERFRDSIQLSLASIYATRLVRAQKEELEQRVIDRTAQLEAAIKEHEAFTYSMAHDLRAPLRHIDGFLELLQKGTAMTLDAQNLHYMTNIAEAANRMGILIDELLSFSRLGRHELARLPVDLNALVQEVIRDFEPETRGRDIQWRAADLPVVTGDRALLRVVLANLISNALKFTRSRPQAEIEIGCEPGTATDTIVFVRDNGVGFDMTYVDKLFGVFQRLHPADEFEGTGIGLANVRRIIHRHGGQTWAEGAVDHGATFYFSLPQLTPGGG